MGHGPIVSVTEYNNRLEILRKYVLEARKIISNNYESVSLVLPGENTYKDGVFHYKVKNLVGTRPPFKSDEIKTDIPMDSSKKYLIHGANSPVELLPFFDIIESPEKEQEACYFYNRNNKKTGEARFVSYHFEKEAEIFIPNGKIQSTFNLLNK